MPSRWLVAALLGAAGIVGLYIELDCWHLAVFMVFVFHVTRGRFDRTVWAMSGLSLVNAVFFAVVSALTGDSGYQQFNFINPA